MGNIYCLNLVAIFSLVGLSIFFRGMSCYNIRKLYSSLLLLWAKLNLLADLLFMFIWISLCTHLFSCVWSFEKQRNTKKFYLMFRHLFHFNEYTTMKIWNIFLAKYCMTFNMQIISKTEECISVSRIGA